MRWFQQDPEIAPVSPLWGIHLIAKIMNG